MNRCVYVALLVLALAFTSKTVWAGSYLRDEVQFCTTANCSSQNIRGVYQPQEPFILQIRGEVNRCLRLHITNQSQDMEMQLIGPNGSAGSGAGAVPNMMWADDDSGGLGRPLIKVNPVPMTGWYTLIVSHWAGGSTFGIFNLKYGMYNLNNPNCSNPSPPLDPVFREVTESADTVKIPE